MGKVVEFPVAKLLDYANDLVAPEADANPFGLLVLAHLQSQATRNYPESRSAPKARLLRELLDRGCEPQAHERLNL